MAFPICVAFRLRELQTRFEVLTTRSRVAPDELYDRAEAIYEEAADWALPSPATHIW